ncbi:unnamed protein product [Schistosoma bovis]|nr:unnamed protein product [Schistosoma bovis]
MPLKLNFKRTHRYNVAAKDLHVIRIYTLDNTCVEYTVSSSTTGRDALEYVAQRLDIEDIYFFGFTYEDWAGEQKCLFLNKSIKKQLDKYARQHALTLTVMLFIDNPQFLPDPQIRRWFYLQLRRNVAMGLLPVTLKLAIKLQAYSLQAEFGDFVDIETTLSNWRERNLHSETSVVGAFDLSTTEYVDDIVWGYSHLQGVSQDNAIWYFLDEIRHNPLYGVRTFSGMTCSNEVAELGVSRNGINITTFEPQRQTIANLKWEHIKDLTYTRKTFTIQLLKRGKSVHFIFEDYESARYLWQFCIQMHSSYIDYWTHVKSVPPQPAVHISEPPDILRGTELRCTYSGSPVLNDFAAELSTSEQPSQQYTKYDVEPVNDESQRIQQNNADPQHSGGLINPCKLIDPFKIESNTTALTSDNKTFRINPSLRRPSEATCMVSCNSNFIQNTFVSKVTTTNADFKEQNADSESGTLVGHWSLKSGAGTLDSQLLNKGCVTCLPGRECLKPTGWFLSKSGVANTTSAVSKESKITFSDQQSSKTCSSLAPLTNKEMQINHEDSSFVQNKQHNTSEITEEHKITKSHRSHKHRQTKRHHQEQIKPNIAITSEMTNRHENTNCCEPLSPLHLSTVDVVLSKKEVCPEQSSPSSLASSDSSSEHVLVSPRASFSSSSSSCTASIKKIDLVHAAQHQSCSSSTSSSSSNSITQADFEANEARKTSFGFAASLCTSANNVTFKSPSKSNTRGLSSGSGPTFPSGRKLWHELIHSNSGGILPLLSGLSQRHYRPQSQMKRFQASTSIAPEAIVQKPDFEAVTTSYIQNRHNSKKTVDGLSTHIHKSSTQLSPSNNPLQEFQRWFSSAKHRIPFGWTSNATSRGTAMNISAPLPYQTSGNCYESHVTRSEKEQCLDVTSNPVSSTAHQNINNQSTSKTGRLERSASESYSRSVSSSLNNSRTIVLVNLEQSSVDDANPQKLKSSTKDSKNTTVNETKILTPSIHLLPPSPTRSSFKISGNKEINVVKGDLHDSKVLLTSCSNFNSKPESNNSEKKHPEDNEIYNKSNVNKVNLISEPKNNFLSNLQSRNFTRPLNQSTQQEQGNFRTSSSSSWRLFPCPLTLNEANRLAVTPPRKFINSVSDNCCSSPTEFHPNRPMYNVSGYQHSNFNHGPRVNLDISHTTITEATFREEMDGKRQIIKNTLNNNMCQRHFSTTPTTPVSRPNLLWKEASDQPCDHGSSRELAHSLREQDECDNNKQTNVDVKGPVSSSTNVNRECSSVINTWSSNNQLKSKSVVDDENCILDTMENSQELENKPSSNTLLTTSSSSDQCSIPRPSSGTMHLLTNSDIHQLLSLTNLKETELAHRLLAEYRQALLQQQCLHTNSVSTPNLTASQELQVLSSSNAAEDIEVQGDQINTSAPEKPRYKTFNKRSDDSRKTSKKSHGTNHISSDSMRNPSEVSHSSQTALRLKVRCNRNIEIQSIDSPDYVNAAAFRNDRRHTNERPLSLASSTDIDSNATFRVLSSFEMRTSSGGNYSTGNLILTNCSIGSEEATMGLSVDLTNPDSQPGVESMTSHSSNKSWDQEQKSITEGNHLQDHKDNNSNTEVCLHEDLTCTDVDKLNIYGQPPDLCMTQKGTSFSIKEYLNKPRSKVQCNHLNSQRRHVIGEYENLEAISCEKNKKNYLPDYLCRSTHEHHDGNHCISHDSQPQRTLSKNVISSCNTPPESLTTLTRSGESTSPSPSTYSESSSTLSSSSPYSDLGCIDSIKRVSLRKRSAGKTPFNTRNEVQHSLPWRQLCYLEGGTKFKRNHSKDEKYCQMFSTVITPRFKKRIKYCNCSCHKSVEHLKINKPNSSRTETNDLSLIDVSNPSGYRRIKQKAHSFEPFSKITNAKPSEHHYTSVCFEDVSKGVVPSESASSNIQEYQRKHIKSSNRKSHHIIASNIPVSVNRSNYPPCCYCEQMDYHSHNDVSDSMNTSPTDSPCLSSASSYSFSTSSLDVQPVFDCPHHFHIPSYTSVVIGHKSGRNHRSGSLEPSSIIHRSIPRKPKPRNFTKSSKRRLSVRKEYHNGNSQSTNSVGLHYSENYKREHCSCCEFHESPTKRDLLEQYNRNNNNSSNTNSINDNKTINNKSVNLFFRLPFTNGYHDNDSSKYSRHFDHGLKNDEKPPIIVKRKFNGLNNGNNITCQHTHRGEYYSTKEKNLTDTPFIQKGINNNDDTVATTTSSTATITNNNNNSNTYSCNHQNRSAQNFENEGSFKPPRPKDLKVFSRNQNFSPVDLTKYRSSSGKMISFFKKKIPSESQIMAHDQLQEMNKSTEKEAIKCSWTEKGNLPTPNASIHTPLPSPDLLCRPNAKNNGYAVGSLRPSKVSDYRRENLIKLDDSAYSNKLLYHECYQEHENHRKNGPKFSPLNEPCQLEEPQESGQNTFVKPSAKTIKQKLSPTNDLSPTHALVYTASVEFGPKQQSDPNTINSNHSSVVHEKSKAYERQSEPRNIPLIRNGSMEPDDSNKKNTTLRKGNISTIPLIATDHSCI